MKPELIETMRADTHGRIELWDLHMKRLSRSASLMGYAIPTPAAIAIQVAQHIAVSRAAQTPHPEAWRVRLLLNDQGSISVTAAPLAPLLLPQKVALSRTPLNSAEFWLQHKSTHRPWYDQATAWLSENPDYFDVLFLNERGELCEGSRSNVYRQRQQQWQTPALACGLLPGVWRTHLLQQGHVTESCIPGDQLHDGTLLRLSNGLRGWFEVQLDTQIRID